MIETTAKEQSSEPVSLRSPSWGISAGQPSGSRAHSTPDSREFTTPERAVWTFSIAVSNKHEEGNDVTGWSRCDDWGRHSRLVGKGCRMKDRPNFRERTYKMNGETKTMPDFVGEDIKTEPHRILHRAELGLSGVRTPS